MTIHKDSFIVLIAFKITVTVRIERVTNVISEESILKLPQSICVKILAIIDTLRFILLSLRFILLLIELISVCSFRLVHVVIPHAFKIMLQMIGINLMNVVVVFLRQLSVILLHVLFIVVVGAKKVALTKLSNLIILLILGLFLLLL